MEWHGARTLVTGGASFIGSHLVDALVERGSPVRVVDNSSSGTLDNIRGHIDAGHGERSHENHALTAMIARAFVRQKPFIVWGTGAQVRNWTHVSDIVLGTILAAEKIDNGAAVNLGTMERTRVIDAARGECAPTPSDERSSPHWPCHE